MVSGQFGLPLLQNLKDVRLSKERHDLVVVSWEDRCVDVRQSLTAHRRAACSACVRALTDWDNVLGLPPASGGEGAGRPGDDGRACVTMVLVPLQRHHL